MKPATFNRHGLFFSQLFQIAVSDQVITKSPLETVNTRKRIIREKPHIPTPEQFQAILADVRGQRFNAHAGHSADFIEFLGLAGLGQAVERQLEIPSGSSLIEVPMLVRKSQFLPIESAAHVLVWGQELLGKIFVAKLPMSEATAACPPATAASATP